MVCSFMIDLKAQHTRAMAVGEEELRFIIGLALGGEFADNLQ